MANKIEFDIKENVGIISSEGESWNKEVNVVDWGRGEKYDIRPWNETHDKMGKGITMTEDELRQLYGILKNLFEPDSLNFKKDN